MMFVLENRGKQSVKMTILISHYLHFGALNILTGDCSVFRINQHSLCQHIQNKKWDVLSISVSFTTIIPQHVFPYSFV